MHGVQTGGTAHSLISSSSAIALKVWRCVCVNGCDHDLQQFR